MPKAPTGSIVWNRDRTLASARVRCPVLPGDKTSFPMPNSSGSETEAAARCKVVSETAQRMVAIDAHLAETLLADVAAAPQPKLRAACGNAQKWIGGEFNMPSGVPTVRALGTLWTDGTLYKLHKVDFKKKMSEQSAYQTDKLLSKWIYPVVGEVPVDGITKEVQKRVKAKLSAAEGLDHDSMRNVLARFRALLNIAVYPCEYIEHSPLPKGWVPGTKAAKAKAMIYPDDDVELLGCLDVSIHWRMFWGFFGHEGMRPHNVVALRLSDVDLERNSVTVDESKTDARIMFAMTPGTREALRVYLRRYRPSAKPSDFLFIDDDGGPIPLARIAPTLREHFETAGVLARRPELAIDNAKRRNLVAYDYRAAFITIKLAAGWSPDDIQAHTAHVDTRMFQTYKRAAETFDQLELAARDFVPLIAAIPELQTSPDGNGSDPEESKSFGPGLARRSAKPALSLASDKSSQDFVLGSQAPDMPKIPQKPIALISSSPVQPSASGQTPANPDALALQADVRRLELELEIERRVGERFSALIGGGLVAQLAPVLAAASVAAVISELQRKGIVERARPTLVKVDDGEKDDGEEV